MARIEPIQPEEATGKAKELLDAVHYLTKAKSITDKFKGKEKLLNELLAKAKEDTFTVKESNAEIQKEI